MYKIDNNVLERKMMYEGTVVLTYKINYPSIEAKAHNFVQKLKTSLASITKFMPKTITTGMDSSVMLANQQNQLMMEQINQQNFINQLNQDNMVHMQAMGMM